LNGRKPSAAAIPGATPLLTETEATVLRAIFRTHSRNHSYLAIHARLPEQIVGGAVARLARKGFIKIAPGMIRPVRTLTGAPLQRLTEEQEQAMVEKAVKQRRVKKCPDSHAMGALTFLPFGGRWFS